MAVNYTNPGWSNGIAPALNDNNMNDISDALEQLASGLNALTTQLSGYNALAAQVAQNTADLAGVKSTVLVQQGVTVNVADWTADATYSSDGFNYKADVAFTGVTSAYTPIVCFEMPDALSSNFGPSSVSNTDTVTIWAKTTPSAAINISIVALKNMTA